MRNQNVFDPESEELLNPRKIIPSDPEFPKTVLVMFRQKTMNCLLEQSDAEQIGTLNVGLYSPLYRISEQGQTLAAFVSPCGGPATVGLLEEVVARGAEKILLFGSCGVLVEDLPAGHLIVPTAAYRGEGTSAYYAPAGDWIDIETAPKLCRILGALHLTYCCGKTWTTDAIYRETERLVADRRSDGCMVVEMECASVMAMSRFRGVEAYQFLYAEDSLAGAKWDPRTMGKVPATATEQYVRIALETALRL